MQFIDKPTQTEAQTSTTGMQFIDKQPMSTASKVGVGIGSTVGGLGVAKAAGKLFEGVGKFTYGLNLPPVMKEAEQLQSYNAGTSNIKPVTAAQTSLEQPLFQKGGRTLSSKLGGIGTRSMIGTQSEAAANQVFTKTINPAFDLAEQQGIKVKYNDLVNKAKENILNAKKRSETQKKDIIKNITELGKQYKGETTLKNLDLEKQAVVNKIPKSQMNLPKPTSEAQAASRELGNIFRNTVHENLSKVAGIDTAKEYQKYANLKGLSKIGPKALTEAGRKGGAGTFLSWAADELATPITTTAGKLSYKLGKGLQKVPDFLLNAVKNAPKNIKLALKSNPAMIITPDLLSMTNESLPKIRAKIEENIKNGVLKDPKFKSLNK